MSQVPSELQYTNSHEWVRPEGDGVYVVGISDHAQSLLGDMVFIDVPEAGMSINAGDDCAVAESVKAASDIYSPLTGEIIEVNEDLEGAPELVNSDPYGDGWLFKVKAEDEDEVNDLLSAEAYEELIEDEE